MSSTASVYGPDEEENSSDHESFGRGIFPTGFTTSSPPLQNLRLASNTEVSSPSRPQSSGANGHFPPWKNGSQANTKPCTKNYVKLFNEFVEGAVLGASGTSGSSLAPSQIGVVTWSSQEKEMLFNALEKKGKGRIPEIALLLGSKSEMEIRDYLGVLHQGLENKLLKSRYSKALILSDIPAASEISEECCQALENNALALSRLDELSENTTGKRKHGDRWLVDRHVAAMVEDELDAERDRSDDGGAEDINNLRLPPNILATSQLLNLGNWILLSERIFMNAGRSRIEDNWNNLRVNDETPSLSCEAFADFYTLMVSLTRRLVQTSIFFAMSRLRSLQRGGYQRGKLVRREDVGAALDTLKMSHDSRKFWIGAPRRHDLDVEDIRHAKGFKPVPLTYDEVEEQLSLDGTRSKISRASSVAQSVSVSENQSEAEALSGDEDSSVSTVSSVEDEPLSDPEEIHAELMDQKSSRIEELQLWRQLKQSPPQSLLLENGDSDVEMGGVDKGAAVRPLGTRKTKQDLIDWRDRILYRSEWEEFGLETTLVEEELSEKRRKRRRIE
ncbi:hypothetical protein AJ78_01548 [Emergomyces pasteurianus Ep9510]|uniref:Myb-like domain-containing protein n=1 Tax=Emergomyces pasteurianus Ep9510 TaxID=1447872 RepID=A0A1J9QT28_9EURO|nr:hypothetical protein AJ78_01548 [Emergomyces pasteurianus Ep9510]